MRSSVLAFSIASIAVALAGCSYDVRFESEPSGAAVYVDGNYIGETPLTHEMSELGDPYMLSLRLPGYTTHSEMICQQPTGQTISTTNGGTNTVGQSTAFGSANRPTPYSPAHFYATGTTNTYQSNYSNTVSTPVYAWPTRIFVPLQPAGGAIGSRIMSSPRPSSTTVAFCSACGAKLTDQVRFCGACGARVQ